MQVAWKRGSTIGDSKRLHTGVQILDGATVAANSPGSTFCLLLRPDARKILTPVVTIRGAQEHVARRDMSALLKRLLSGFLGGYGLIAPSEIPGSLIRDVPQDTVKIGVA